MRPLCTDTVLLAQHPLDHVRERREVGQQLRVRRLRRRRLPLRQQLPPRRRTLHVRVRLLRGVVDSVLARLERRLRVHTTTTQRRGCCQPTC